jgi:hypothetical protein
MRSEVRIRFAGNHFPGGAQAILGLSGCGQDVATVEDVPVLRQIEVWVTLEEADPRVPVLTQLLKQNGVGWLERHLDRYTEEELDDARMLLMCSNRQCEIDGGVEWGMTYDMAHACPACGTGARQASAVFVDGEHIADLEGHRAGATYHNHYLVDEGIAAELEGIGAAGLKLRNVYGVMPDKRQVKLRWRQLTAERTLPPMSAATTGLARERACEVCRRNGYFRMDEAPTRILYRRSDLHEADDVNMSWENYWFAVLRPDLRESLLSSPWLLVTPKVRRVFRDAGVTSFEWVPIRIEDGETIG